MSRSWELVLRDMLEAARKEISYTNELRALIESRFAGKDQVPARSEGSKDEALRRLRERWKDLPETKPEEIEEWLKKSRP